MRGEKRLSIVAPSAVLKAALEYTELLKKLGVNLKPADSTEGKIIVFVIHRNTHIGTVIFESMLTELEQYGFLVNGVYRAYFMSNIERAKMSRYFEKANVVLLLDHPEISHDIELYDELKNLWPKTPK